MFSVTSYGKTYSSPQNMDFEQVNTDKAPKYWSSPSPVFSTSTKYAKNGNRSLHYHNEDSNVKKLNTQHVKLKKNKVYRLSGWVKSDKDLNGGKLSIAVEWKNKHGKFLGGVYKHYKATEDWVKIKTKEFTVPSNAKNTSIICYVTKGGKGNAWFDNLQLESRSRGLMYMVVLEKPNYRGRIKNSNGPIEISGKTIQQDNNEKFQITASLSNKRGDVVSSTTKKYKPGEHFNISVPIKKASPGLYNLVLFVNQINNRQRNYSRSWDIHILSSKATKPTVYIDSHNRLIYKNQAMFPIGVYTHMRSGGRANEAAKAMDMLEDTDFNCIVSYGIPNKNILEHGLKKGIFMIPSIKEKKYYKQKYLKSNKALDNNKPVTTLKKEPALLAWYINDESGLKELPKLEAKYNWIKHIDPNHPTYSVTNKPLILNSYLQTFDVVGGDTYPLKNKGGDISRVTRFMKSIMQHTQKSRPVWQVIQAFNWKNYNRDYGRTPDQTELRNMIWQAITYGANGIVLYSLYDMEGRNITDDGSSWKGGNPDRPFKEYWPKVKKLASELNQWAPILLSIDNTPEIKIVYPKKHSWISFRTSTWKDRTFVFAVNNSRKEHKARFITDSNIDHVRLIDLIKNKHKDLKAKGNVWEDTFKPLSVKVYELDGKGEDLPEPQNIYPMGNN